MREGCRTLVNRDYDRFSRGMRPIRRIPESETLAVGGASLGIEVFRGPATVGEGPIGFRLRMPKAADGLRSAGAPVRVISRLDLVKRSGVVARKLGDANESLIERGRPRRGLVPITFHVSNRPTFYKVTLTFISRDGLRLARVAEYSRVLQPRGRVRLSIQRTHLRAGEDLVTKLENLGTRNAFFGLDLQVDRFRDGAWQPLPTVGNIQPALTLGGGSTEICPERSVKIFSTESPPYRPVPHITGPLYYELGPGHYRVSKQVDVEGGRKHVLRADFFVLG